jgi:hypothetical protein
MSADLTPIILMAGLTIVAFMIAINTHGLLRMCVSYTLAAVLLGLTAVVFFNHAGVIPGKWSRRIELSAEPVERGIDDRPSPAHAAEIPLPQKVRLAAELRRVAAEGTACANSLLSRELKDESVELETLVGRASETRRRVEFIKSEFDRVQASDAAFRKPLEAIKTGIQQLAEAAQLYLQYYYAEDSNQEETCEKLLRQKAKGANEQFQKASNMLSAYK